MLAGSLGAFPIADVLALLAMSSKSGTLRIKSPGTPDGAFDVHGWLADGDLVYAVRRLDAIPLAARLRHDGRIDDEVAANLLKVQRGGGPVAVLDALAATDVEPATVHEVVREQVLDVLFHLLGVNGGEFAFAPADSDLELATRFAIPELVAEAKQRRERWDAVSKRIGSVEGYPRLVSRPVADDGHVLLSLDDWMVVTLVDGRQRVRELADSSGLSEFRLCERLAALVDAGLVELREQPAGIPAPRFAEPLPVAPVKRPIEAPAVTTAPKPPSNDPGAIPASTPEHHTVAPVPPLVPVASQRPVAERPPRADVDRVDMARELASLLGEGPSGGRR